jgi:hypothetical protein
VTAIPIRRDLATRKGYYRAVFRDTDDFRLLVPIRFSGHLTFADLCAWPSSCDWKQLVYVPEKRRSDTVGRVML